MCSVQFCLWAVFPSVGSARPPTSDRFPRLTEPLNHCPLTSGLGIPKEKIFTGYDAIDNAYFAAKADEVRNVAK